MLSYGNWIDSLQHAFRNAIMPALAAVQTGLEVLRGLLGLTR